MLDRRSPAELTPLRKPDAMPPPEALLFDVNETLLDLTPVRESVGEALGGRADLVPLWFRTTLHHSLVATVAEQRVNFAQVAAGALRAVGEGIGVELTDERAREAIAPIKSLPAHADAAPALERLRDAGVRMAALSNSPVDTLAAQLAFAGLEGFFEAAMSVEEVGVFKPHARVYRWAAERLDAPAGACMLVAAHGWDVAGARWAGLRAAFVARPGQALIPWAPAPETTGATLGEIADALLA